MIGHHGPIGDVRPPEREIPLPPIPAAPTLEEARFFCRAQGRALHRLDLELQARDDRYIASQMAHLQEIARLKAENERLRHEVLLNNLARDDRDGAYLAMNREHARANRLQAELDALRAKHAG